MKKPDEKREQPDLSDSILNGYLWIGWWGILLLVKLSGN